MLFAFQHPPGMISDGVFQFKGPRSVPNCRAAQENMGLGTDMADLFHAEYLLNVDPQQLVRFVLYAKP